MYVCVCVCLCLCMCVFVYKCISLCVYVCVHVWGCACVCVWIGGERLHTVSTQILSESIMHECMIRLLKSASDEESLECFAKLMATTGKDLDKEEAKVCVQPFQEFARICHSKKFVGLTKEHCSGVYLCNVPSSLQIGRLAYAMSLVVSRLVD